MSSSDRSGAGASVTSAGAAAGLAERLPPVNSTLLVLTFRVRRVSPSRPFHDCGLQAAFEVQAGALGQVLGDLFSGVAEETDVVPVLGFAPVLARTAALVRADGERGDGVAVAACSEVLRLRRGCRR